MNIAQHKGIKLLKTSQVCFGFFFFFCNSIMCVLTTNFVDDNIMSQHQKAVHACLCIFQDIGPQSMSVFQTTFHSGSQESYEVLQNVWQDWDNIGVR